MFTVFALWTDPWSCVYFVITGQHCYEPCPGEHENTGRLLDEGTRCHQHESVKSARMNESWRQTSWTVKGDGSMQALGQFRTEPAEVGKET